MKLLKYKNRDVVPIVESYENHSLRLELIDIDTGMPVKEITVQPESELPYGYAQINDFDDNGGIYLWLLQKQIIRKMVAMDNGYPIAGVNMFILFGLDEHGASEYKNHFGENRIFPDFQVKRNVYAASQLYKSFFNQKGVSK